MPAGLAVFQDAGLIEEEAPDRAFVEQPEIGQLLRRIVPLESGFFGTDWKMVIRNEYLPLTTSLRIRRRKAPPGGGKEEGGVLRAEVDGE